MAQSRTNQYKQFILRVPDDLRDKVRAFVNEESDAQLALLPKGTGAEDKLIEFDFQIGDQMYPALLVNLPCVVETHKTFDHVTYFKGGDIGQMILVFNTADEREQLRQTEFNNKLAGTDYYSSGLTIPTYNIVKRRFARTRLHSPFEPEDVHRVENELSQYKPDDDVHDIYEEVVDFEDYMVSDEMPGGITVDLHSDVVRQHPEIADRPDDYVPSKEDLRIAEEEINRSHARGEVPKLRKGPGQGGPGRPPNKPSKPKKKPTATASASSPAPGPSSAHVSASMAAPAAAPLPVGQPGASSAPSAEQVEMQQVLQIKLKELASYQQNLAALRAQVTASVQPLIKARYEGQLNAQERQVAEVQREIEQLRKKL